jgi:hypothetical protein
MGEMKGVDAYRENAKPEEEEERKYLYLRWTFWRAFWLTLILCVSFIAVFRWGKMVAQIEERRDPPACQDEVVMMIPRPIFENTWRCSDPRANQKLEHIGNNDMLICTCPRAAPSKAPSKELSLECIKAWVLEGPSGTYDEWKSKPKYCER